MNKGSKYFIYEIERALKVGYWDKKLFKELEETLIHYEQALTPPTEQEVCEALSEYSNKKVYYENGKFEVGKYEPSICYLQEDNIVWFNWFKLPPHIITMIGRFYEGKKNE